MDDRRQSDIDLATSIGAINTNISWLIETVKRIEDKLSSSCSEPEVSQIVSASIEPVKTEVRQLKTDLKDHKKTHRWIIGIAVTLLAVAVAGTGIAVSHYDADKALSAVSTASKNNNK